MTSSTARVLILFLSFLIAAIIAVQIHWLNKTYSLEKNEFNTSVIKSIRGLYEDMNLADEPGSRLNNLIEKPNPNTFIFKIDSIPSEDSLVYYLTNEFDDFNVFTDCRLAVYDKRSGKYSHEIYLPSIASVHNKDTAFLLPVIKKSFNYVHLFFPHRSKYIISQMRGWILISALLLVMLIGFAGVLYYFFRQKFLNEVQKDFISNVTHEFSTPVAVLELSADMLANPAILNKPERHAKYVASIKQQADYLKKHIETLIKTVVTDKYNLTLNKSAVKPNELIEKGVLQIDPLVQQKGGKVVLSLDKENQSIQADPENLFLAIFNIISNAVKYSGQPVVQIATYQDGDNYYISVKDNGVGIAPGMKKKIFKKFYRIPNGNVHNVKGLGLGLYFTKRVIDMHGGNIIVNSAPGIGTEFKIELPLN
jgi:two-component system phosphate regulon sensor histidine kinase PhoR